MEIKDSVIMAGLKIEMRKALIYAEAEYKARNQSLVVTSALDGTHSASSVHYYGYALDFRTRDTPFEVVAVIAESLRLRLGAQYRVIVHSTHMHVEYRGGI